MYSVSLMAVCLPPCCLLRGLVWRVPFWACQHDNLCGLPAADMPGGPLQRLQRLSVPLQPLQRNRAFEGSATVPTCLACVQLTRPEGLYDKTVPGGESGMRPRSSVDPVKPMNYPDPKMDMDREDTAHGASHV